MINDEKRREIAGNLRYCAEMCHSVGVLDSDVLNALDIGCGDTDGVSSAYDVEKLADLIDPPVKGTAEGTCRTCAKYDGSVCILDDFAPGSLDNTCAYDSYEARAVTDAERREVVERLRAPMESMLADSVGELIRLRRVTGCRRGQDIYERLADLIEGKN